MAKAEEETPSFIKPVRVKSSNSTTLGVGPDGAKALDRITAHYAKKAGVGLTVSRKMLLDSILVAEAKRLKV